VLTRHWRRERWAVAGRRGSPRLEQELDEHRAYVDGLERRVAELEERLDFTERLLAGRRRPRAETEPVRPSDNRPTFRNRVGRSSFLELRMPRQLHPERSEGPAPPSLMLAELVPRFARDEASHCLAPN
jgi:hypothetical protein